MSRLTRDGTAEPVSRDQILRRGWGQGSIHFPCSAGHEQDWQPYPVDPSRAICDDHTYTRHPFEKVTFLGHRKPFRRKSAPLGRRRMIPSCSSKLWDCVYSTHFVVWGTYCQHCVDAHRFSLQSCCRRGMTASYSVSLVGGCGHFRVFSTVYFSVFFLHTRLATI